MKWSLGESLLYIHVQEQAMQLNVFICIFGVCVTYFSYEEEFNISLPSITSIYLNSLSSG